ncbi:Mov34/MPN/PAD-1 family protein [Phenylobacterium sp.]|uniref:Mov34/MPN/PAD-1 family protein n=1 Tax=Phenylobacterium sp. TaxID=1871053 RepID=UPI002FC74F11
MDRVAIQLAIQEIASHPDVTEIANVEIGEFRARVEFDIDLGFGDRWKADGASPTGVRPVERVRFDFSPKYPLRAPVPSLRGNFNFSHAHFMPSRTPDDRPVPCIVFGDLDEFVATLGLIRMVEQSKLWLQKAASDALNQGPTWEPMRRDIVKDFVNCDADEIRTYARGKAGYKFVTAIYRRIVPDRKSGLTTAYHGRLGRRVMKIADARDFLARRPTEDRVEFGLALVLHGAAEVAGRKVVRDKFRPDDVTDLPSFVEQAARFGVEKEFKKAMAALSAAADERLTGIAPLPVIILVERPRPMPDSQSRVELVSYFLQIYMPQAEPVAEEVRPLACLDVARPTLLRRLTGPTTPEAWALLGAGSLGSKIALHGGRAGNAPLYCADHASLRPHNAARHGLYPPPDDGPFSGWMDRKAPALAKAVAGLGAETRPIEGDHVDLVEAIGEPTSPTIDWILNTTGSTVAREWLATADVSKSPRIIEAGLFDRGDLGFVTVEGEVRNPDTAEMMGALYAKSWRADELRRRIFTDEHQQTFVPIGQGCGSATMVMSDAHLSTMAAPMAEIIAAKGKRSASGQLHLLSRSGYGLVHEVEEIAPFVRADLEGLPRWTVSLAPDVLPAIDAEIAQHPGVETGGVLIGWTSVISRRMYVLATLPAPPDSERSASMFRLGVVGLTPALAEIAAQTGGTLLCLGTWHSHLGAATPSGVDWASAAALGLQETLPMTLLIRGRGEMRAISTLAAASAVASLAGGAVA